VSEDVRYGSVAPVWVHRKLNKRRRRKLNKRNKRLRSCVSKRFINKSVIFEPHRRGKVVRCGSIELCEAFDASPLRSDVEALRKSLPGGAARDRTMGPRDERACVCVWRCGRTLAPRGVDRGSRSIAWRARSRQLSTRSKRFVNTSDPRAENQPTRVSCALGLRFGSTSFRYRKLNKRRRRKLNKQNKRLRSCVSKRFANKSVIWVGTGDFGTV